MTRRPSLAAQVVMLLSVLAVASTGCALSDVRTVEGLVIAVESDSPSLVRGFTLRTADGTTLGFVIDSSIDFGHGGFPGAHLREHQALGEPVRVIYRQEGSGADTRRIVLRLEDAA